MVNRKALLSDLQSLLKRLEADLLERSDSTEVPDVGETLRAEYNRAKKAERTAQNYEDWRSDAITQAAAAWVLSCVFVRFLEDNRLIDPPKFAGADDRLQQARDEHELFFRKQPTETDREYLLAVFDELAKLPGTKDVFGEHNPMRELPNWLSGDAAKKLLRFFQQIDGNTGDLVHDFTDADWDTRFLGDLYQDLSEAARKKYALLQTPEFVEKFILDRTLDPALEEFGLDAPPVTDKQGKPVTEPGFRMIDPACGSGHFLLGAFPRVLNRWQKQEPGGKIRDLVQKTLDCIHGVDVNPYAVAIARFRLLLLAMKTSSIEILDGAPAFNLSLTCGDSLLHGAGEQLSFGWRDVDHETYAEDLPKLRSILQPTSFHAVVGNPPYVTPKDNALKSCYRERYSACYKQYSLSVPFLQRIVSLAVRGGFTGQITANSFMKRDFGKRLIEDYLPTVDVTHVIDTSLAYIPAHGTPTLILFARNRKPVQSNVRVLMGISREDREPRDPAKGMYWTALLQQIDAPNSESRYLSVSDLDREVFGRHPWTLGGGGASDLFNRLSEVGEHLLENEAQAIGRVGHTGCDEAYVAPASALRRRSIPARFIADFVEGELLRDWCLNKPSGVLFPYSEEYLPTDESRLDSWYRWLWSFRNQLWKRREPNGTHEEIGKTWYELSRFHPERFIGNGIAFAFVQTHNQFVLLAGRQFCKQSAPVIKLVSKDNIKDHYALLGLLNSSAGGFWMKQVFHDKGGGGIGGGIAAEGWERFREFDGTKIKKFPLPVSKPTVFSERITALTSVLSELSPPTLLQARRSARIQAVLTTSQSQTTVTLQQMVALQEELDWQCYHLYGLLDEDLSTTEPPQIALGQRAFEIVMARQMIAGELETTWFARHGSNPITELPQHWPEVYRRRVERRIELIETDKNIGLIERPEYKRRWNTETWESQLERALRDWLLDRLESCFDFDGRMNDEDQPTAVVDITLTTVAKLSDIARQDPQFMEVGEVYRNDPAFDVQRLVTELVQAEHVPLLPTLHYKAPGLRKRREWEKTWALQRQEDAIDSRASLPKDDPQYLTKDQARDLKQREIGDIPVPPKYKSSDFISTGGARYWSLRGKLDVPKERWVSFPHCEGPDGTLVIAWAGYDHLQLVRAISAYFVDIQERLGGRDDPRLVPLLACVIELLPWLKQWHHDIDPDYNQRMDEVFEGFVTEEAKNLGLTIEEVKAWQPPKRPTKQKTRSSTR